MKILLTGANGFVGKCLYPFLFKKYNLFAFGLGKCEQGVNNLDLTNFPKTKNTFHDIKPEIIIHLAGIKDVFKCEEERGLSQLLNFEVSKNISEICKFLDAKLIFISSDYVFDGENSPFNEESVPSPSTQYGMDKFRTEKSIKSNMDNYALVRSSGIFGCKGDFVDIVIKKLKQENNFYAFDNLYNNPTFIMDFNEMIREIIDRNLNGIFHCAGSETVSRFEFAKAIAKTFGLREDLIKPASLDFSKDVRPQNLGLNNQKTYERLNYFPNRIGEILSNNKDVWSGH